MESLTAQPLSRQIMGATGALLLVLAGAVVWSADRTRSEYESVVKAEAGSIATTAAGDLNQQLDVLDGVASVLIRHPAVVSLQPAESDRLFALWVHTHPLVHDIVLTDTTGATKGSALQSSDRSGHTLAEPYVQQVVSSGRPVVTEFTSAEVLGSTNVIAYPVRASNGAVIGVLAFGLNLARLQGVFASISLPEGSIVFLTDAKGRIMARSRDGEKETGRILSRPPMPSGAQPSTIRAGVDGVERFYRDVPIARGPWVLSVGIPRSVVRDRLAPLWRRNLIIIMSSVGAVVLLSLWLSNRTSRGLKRLQGAVRRIADGDLSPPASVSAPNLEIAQLQDAFVTMAANLRETNLALDRQVEQERKMREMLQSLQLQVVRQERLAAVGLLVSGVAHELNNPLQAILGTVELLERHGKLNPETLEEITFVKKQSGRAREIIRNLSRFSSQQSDPPALIDLRDVISEVVKLRRQDLENTSIAVDVETSSDRKVLANFTELEQVTLNFVINAQQSIQSMGRPNGRIMIRLYDAGKRVRLEVRDNGPGVMAENESKLFQPFFTTKPMGKGTGLGLSVSYGIIDSYGGSIGHHHNEWGGATFFFELPAVEGHASDDRAAVLQRPVLPAV